MRLPRLAEVRKAVTALAGGAAVAVTAGLLHGTAEHWVTGVLTVTTAMLTYLVPNASPPVPDTAEQPSHVHRVVSRADVLPPPGGHRRPPGGSIT